MSKNTIDVHTFTEETIRLEAIRSAAIFQKLGGYGISDTITFEELSDQMVSVPADGLSGLYALGGLTAHNGLSDLERAEDDFDGMVSESFNAERTYGYHFLSSEVGRLALTSEESIRDSNGTVLHHTILAAQIYDGQVALLKTRQSGLKTKTIPVLPEDWQAMQNAVSELSRISSLLENQDS